MGREDLIGDKRYDDPDARTQRREEVDAIVSEWTRKHDKLEAGSLVSLATIPAGAVMDTAELAADQAFAVRGIRATMHHPKSGDYVMSGEPVRFGGQTPAGCPPPLLGQHLAEVLHAWV